MSGPASRDHGLPVLALALLLLCSPFTSFWSRLPLPWYAMFVPWALVIALLWLNRGRLR